MIFAPATTSSCSRARTWARELKRLRAEAEDDLPPAVVLAPWLDWDDVSQAPDHGAAGYLLEHRYAFLLYEALLCTSRGAGIPDPAVVTEQVKAATRARATVRDHLSRIYRKLDVRGQSEAILRWLGHLNT